MVEIGTTPISFETVRDTITKGDLDLNVKIGIVAQVSMGSAKVLQLAVQEYLERCKGQLIYYTITGQPLYIVHFNDLNEQKQASLERRREK